jgi:hypothetical protein
MSCELDRTKIISKNYIYYLCNRPIPKIDHESDSTNIDFNTIPGENYLNSSSLNVDKLNHVEIVKSKPGLDAALLNCFRHLTKELIKITREKNNKLDDKK